MQAYCLETEAVKTFALAKMQLATGAEAGVGPTDEVVLERHLAEAADIPDAMAPFMDWFEELGWHIELYEDAISLHRQFKNGKPRKSQDVMLLRSPDNTHRPWYTNSIQMPMASARKRLADAALIFLEQAQLCAPNPVPLPE
ncbi:hypothetical protein [Microbulbifer taiwanensis]|uniref:hypothetical protein n=1 Tax=Microbulbifer taiwanensis TaxID=986746 RepID=UPI003606C3E5